MGAGAETMADKGINPSASDMRLIIAASSAGTIFEWYDFFIYGALGSILSKTFFPSGNETLEMLLFWLVFAVGFGFRPLGAVLFGYLGDKLGRKYTFLVTVTLMGIATAGVGLVPSSAVIGYAAPAIVILLRVLQGLALGGEYGGAAIYVAEHAPAGRRGFYTGFIQGSVTGGFVLSLIVVLICKYLMGPEIWTTWGWRVPFLLSLGLLAVSLWMRMKLSESPVFKAMQEAGELAGNPFIESFTYPGNKKRIFVALFGVAAGLTGIWYTVTFSARSFLLSAMRMDEMQTDIIVGIGAAIGLCFCVAFGGLSDRIGRKKVILTGYVLTLLLLFPLFWTLGNAANPGLAMAAKNSPVTVAGPDCNYSPFQSEQKSLCGKLLADLTAASVAYTPHSAEQLSLSVGDEALPLASYQWQDKVARGKQLQSWLSPKGYDFAKVKPSFGQSAVIIATFLALFALSGIIYGPVAAQLTEMFPSRIRYSSMSIPYHIGTGYFGGFLPLISSFIAAKTGNPYSGLWYCWGVTLMALVVAAWGLQGGKPRELLDDAR
ncbi:MAG: hypothetical protein RLY97_437 [Pseudomonadota bacterium]